MCVLQAVIQSYLALFFGPSLQSCKVELSLVELPIWGFVTTAELTKPQVISLPLTGGRGSQPCTQHLLRLACGGNSLGRS